jgi:GT2 family glycosyltransferase
LSQVRISVVVPTLSAGQPLAECLEGLSRQTWQDFEVIVVDNSGSGLVRQQHGDRDGVSILENTGNLGFGAAVNRGFEKSAAEFVATLNDDAVPHPNWLARLMALVNETPEAGMWASQIRLAGRGVLDSAGLLLCRDGSSKQRGHGRDPSEFNRREEVLLPSGCAALYRRKMLREIGLFDEDFFLYCEDTDLGLRGRWAGWTCVYAPDAVVEHRYSHSAGRASALKARYVERNRLYLVAKNFPLSLLIGVPLNAALRYWWHIRSLASGSGAAGQFRVEGQSAMALPAFVLRAHWDALVHAPALWGARRKIQHTARITARQFRDLVAAYSISPREVAAQ